MPFIRRVDPFGYIRLYHWRFYGGLGLAGKAIAVWLYAGTLRLAYESVLLARYGVKYERDGKHLRDVFHSRLAMTRYRSPQLPLFELGPDDWLLFVRLPAYAPWKRVALAPIVQLLLPSVVDGLAYVDEASSEAPDAARIAKRGRAFATVDAGGESPTLSCNQYSVSGEEIKQVPA